MSFVAITVLCPVLVRGALVLIVLMQQLEKQWIVWHGWRMLQKRDSGDLFAVLIQPLKYKFLT